MDRTFTEELITKHEGRRVRVYKDSLGILTIGIGWNLEDPQSVDICEHFGLDLDKLKTGQQVLTDPQIDQVFDYQVTQATSSAMSVLPNFATMPDKVQSVVIDIMFQLGLTRFKKFVGTIAAFKAGNWKGAAAHYLDSLLAKQTPNRAADNAAILEAA